MQRDFQPSKKEAKEKRRHEAKYGEQKLPFGLRQPLSPLPLLPLSNRPCSPCRTSSSVWRPGSPTSSSQNRCVERGGGRRGRWMPLLDQRQAPQLGKRKLDRLKGRGCACACVCARVCPCVSKRKSKVRHTRAVLCFTCALSFLPSPPSSARSRSPPLCASAAASFHTEIRYTGMNEHRCDGLQRERERERERERARTT